MATNTVNVRLVHRHDTKTNWATKNPVLLQGEIGIEDDSGLFKIGDGVKAWDALGYANDAKTASHYEVSANDGETDTEAIARALPDTTFNQDDIVIISRVISGTKISKTAYVYDGGAWKALDGNYDAENVYFDADLIATAPIGVVTIPAPGSTTISAEGKNVKQVLSSILAQEKNPTATKPSATITLTNAKAYEVGTTLNPAYTTKFNAGSYTYGPATGITASSYSVSDGTTTKDTANGSFDTLTVGDSTNYKLSLTVAYGNGAIPKTNLGNDYAAAQIKAGNATATSGAITGYRSFFYGVDDTDTAIDSALIRGLTNGGAYGAKTLATFGAHAGAKRVIVAVPANKTGVTKVLMPSAMNADATANFIQQANVNVEGVNGYTATAYKVWVYAPASIDASETYSITLG